MSSLLNGLPTSLHAQHLVVPSQTFSGKLIRVSLMDNFQIRFFVKVTCGFVQKTGKDMARMFFLKILWLFPRNPTPLYLLGDRQDSWLQVFPPPVIPAATTGG